MIGLVLGFFGFLVLGLVGLSWPASLHYCLVGSLIWFGIWAVCGGLLRLLVVLGTSLGFEFLRAWVDEFSKGLGLPAEDRSSITGPIRWVGLAASVWIMVPYLIKNGGFFVGIAFLLRAGTAQMSFSEFDQTRVAIGTGLVLMGAMVGLFADPFSILKWQFFNVGRVERVRVDRITVR